VPGNKHRARGRRRGNPYYSQIGVRRSEEKKTKRGRPQVQHGKMFSQKKKRVQFAGTSTCLKKGK